LCFIEHLRHASTAAAVRTRLKNLVNVSYALQVSRPRLRGVPSGQAVWEWLRPGALSSAMFWLAMVLIPGWAVYAATSHQMQHHLPFAPGNMGDLASDGALTNTGGTPAGVSAPAINGAPANAGAPANTGAPSSASAPSNASTPASIGAPTNNGAPASYSTPPNGRLGGRVTFTEQKKFDPADLPILIRSRPELDPLGVRLGSFLVFPGLKVSEFYDDNILLSESHAQDDFITEIAPRLRIRSTWSQDLLIFEARAAIGQYLQHTNQNYQDYGASLRGQFAVTDSSYFDHEFSYDRKHSDRDSPDDTTGVHPTEYNDLLSTAGFFQQFGKFTLRLDGAFERLDYLNDEEIVGGVVTPLDNSDRDRSLINGTARIGYLVRQDLETYVQASYGVIHYDTSPDDNGFQRDANTYDAIAGLAMDWNGVFEGDVHLGYLAQTSDDPRFDTIDGVDFGGKLAWNVTRLTTLSASVDRRISVTTIKNAAGSLITEAGVAVDHELRRDLLLHFGANWRQNDYSGIDRTDETYEIGVGANYIIARNFNVGASYTYRQRNSNDPAAEYMRNLIMLNLDARF
jgi:hypothetical protein